MRIQLLRAWIIFKCYFLLAASFGFLNSSRFLLDFLAQPSPSHRRAAVGGRASSSPLPLELAFSARLDNEPSRAELARYQNEPKRAEPACYHNEPKLSKRAEASRADPSQLDIHP